MKARYQWLCLFSCLHIAKTYKHFRLTEGASLEGLESLSIGLNSPSSDTQIISANFEGQVITSCFGKIVAIILWVPKKADLSTFPIIAGFLDKLI